MILVNFLLLYPFRIWLSKSFLLTRKTPSITPIDLAVLVVMAILFGFLFCQIWNSWVQKKLQTFRQLIQKPSPSHWTLFIFTVAFLLRLCWTLSHSLIFGSWTAHSDLLYPTLAQNLLSHKGFFLSQGATALFPPAYPFFLSISYYFFGIGNDLAARVGNVLLSAGIVVSSYWLFRRLMGEPVARLTALILALSWHQIFYCDRLILECALTLTTLGILYFSIPPRPKILLVSTGIVALSLAWIIAVYGYSGPIAILALSLFTLILLAMRLFPTIKEEIALGILVGLALLVKPIFMFYPLVLFFLGSLDHRNWISSIQKAGVVFLIMILTISPWLVRNFLIFKTPTFVMTSGGVCLWEFNEALLKSVDPEHEKMRVYHRQVTALMIGNVLQEKEPDPRLLMDVNEAQAEKILRKRALSFLEVSLVKYPIQTMTFFAKKALSFLLNPLGPVVEQLFRYCLWPYEKPWQWFSYLTLQLGNQFFYNCFFLLAVWGIMDVTRNLKDKKGLIPLIMIFYFLIFLLPFAPMERYRFPIWPFVYVYVAHALVRLDRSL